MFVLEFLMMSLHVSLDDIQLFAGRAGEEEARRVYPYVRTWTQEMESRKAIWHAGQVLHHAGLFEKTRLRDFYAVATYHASLTLWVWGMVTLGTTRQSRIQTPVGNSSQQPASMQTPTSASRAKTRAVLNGPEDKTTKSFVQLGHGVPGLQGNTSATSEIADARPASSSKTFCSLSDSRGVMTFSARLLRGNFPHVKGGFPPLVENLANLLDELGSLPT